MTDIKKIKLSKIWDYPSYTIELIVDEAEAETALRGFAVIGISLDKFVLLFLKFVAELFQPKNEYAEECYGFLDLIETLKGAHLHIN